MPIYEYHCPHCGEDFERLVYGQATVSCPGCSGKDAVRGLSSFAFRSGSRFVTSSGGCGSGCGCAAGGGGG